MTLMFILTKLPLMNVFREVCWDLVPNNFWTDEPIVWHTDDPSSVLHEYQLTHHDSNEIQNPYLLHILQYFFIKLNN